MTDEGKDQAWWRDRLWEMRHEVSGHGQRLVALDERDRAQDQDMKELEQRLGREIRDLRAEQSGSFASLQKTIELHVGALRADVQSLERLENGPPRIPIKWVILVACVTLVAVAATAFGIGVAWQAHDTKAVLSGAVTP